MERECSLMTRPINALDLLARDRAMDFQELTDEAFSDVLKSTGALQTSSRRCVRASAMRARFATTRTRRIRAISARLVEGQSNPSQ